MRQSKFVRQTLVPLTLALTLAACGSQTATQDMSAARRDGPPPGATVQEYAATPILPISTLPETLEKHPELRELLRKAGRLDAMLARAAAAKGNLTASAANGGSCHPVQWVAEANGRMKMGDSIKCSVPFVNAWMETWVRDRHDTYQAREELEVPGDGVRKSTGVHEVSVPLHPNWTYKLDWREIVEFSDGSYWYTPNSDTHFYTSSSPKIALRTPQTLGGATFKRQGDAYTDLKWTSPPTGFLAAGHRIYDVTAKRTLLVDRFDYFRGDRQEFAGAYTPRMRRRYEVCVYNKGEELCSNAYTAQWDTDQVPVAVLSATPLTGDAPLKVDFDASASYDPDGRIVSYQWQFGDPSNLETTTDPTVSHVYGRPGEYRVTLTVTDANGNKGETVMSQTVRVADPAPQVTAHSTTVNGVPSRQVVLTWTPARNIEVNEYEVYRALSGEATPSLIGSVGSTETSYTDELGTTTQSYVSYWVCAVNRSTGAESCSEGTFMMLDS